MTIREARKEIIQNIIAIYDKSEADNIAEIALEHITGLSRTERASMSTSLSSKQEKLLSQTIGRLGKHEPIQYIINQTWFAGMKFYVDKNVLIPRPETEELVEWVISDFRFRLPDSFIQQPIPNLKSNSKFQISNFRFLDVGTGSGCIAIALKTKLPQV
jgi:release factor glutamine methyltransferase